MPSFLVTLRQVVHDQLEVGITADSAAADRHVRFVLALLAIGAAGVAVLPLWLVAGMPGTLAPIAFVLLSAPLLVAGLVLRSGRLETGQHLATFALTALVVVTAAAFGLLPAALLFSAVPLVTMLGGGARAVVVALAAAALGLGLGVALGLTGTLGPAVSAGHAALAGALGLAAIAAAAAFALRRVLRPSRAVARKAEDVANAAAVPAGPGDASDGAAGMLAPGLRGTVDSLVDLSAMLAEGRNVRDEDRRRIAGLARALGASARLGIDRLLEVTGAAPEPAEEVRGPGRCDDVAGALGEAIAATAALAAGQGICVRFAGDDELLRLPLDVDAYVPVFADAVAWAIPVCRPDDDLIAALDETDGRLRLSLRSGEPAAQQPFLQPRAPYTGGGREAGPRLAEIGRRMAALGGELKLGRRGSGGVIVALHLPVAAAARGGDRHEEEPSIEVRKSA